MREEIFFFKKKVREKRTRNKIMKGRKEGDEDIDQLIDGLYVFFRSGLLVFLKNEGSELFWTWKGGVLYISLYFYLLEK
jgi:hypothetical protein